MVGHEVPGVGLRNSINASGVKRRLLPPRLSRLHAYAHLFFVKVSANQPEVVR